MGILDEYNNFRDSIVIKVTIDGKVKVKDLPGDGREIISLSRPELVLEFHHTNHKYHQVGKYFKIRMRLTGISDMSGLIELVCPGGRIKDVIKNNSHIVFTDKSGKHSTVSCHTVGVTVLK